MNFLLFLLLYFSLAFNPGKADYVKIPLNDSYLCGYGRSRKICAKENTIVPCIETIDTKFCLSAVLTLPAFDVNVLITALSEMDNDISIRRIEIQIGGKLSYRQYGNKVDHFLMTRPWWRVINEPYESEKTNHAVVFERSSKLINEYFKLLTDLYYPSMEKCGKTPLHVFTDTMIHPGWGAALQKLVRHSFETPYKIILFYSSEGNKGNEATAFISREECPNVRNRWLCGFLSMTNCTFPDLLTKCQVGHCIANYNNGLFSNATEKGEYLGKPSISKILQLVSKNHNDIKSDELKFKSLLFTGSLPYKIIKHDNISFIMESIKRGHYQSSGLQSRESALIDFALRPNYFMREKVFQFIESYRKLHNIAKTDRCVAAHVRRGDRMVYGVNMTDWCSWTNVTKRDKGCDKRPFYDISMEEILDHSEDLVEPSVRTLFVASDDEPWIIEQKEKVKISYPSWKIVFVPAPKPPPDYKEHTVKGHYKGYKYMRTYGGSESGAYFLATIKAMQQCEGYIGHFGSATSWLFYRRLCSQHGGFEGVCPPRVDLSTTWIRNKDNDTASNHQ